MYAVLVMRRTPPVPAEQGTARLTSDERLDGVDVYGPYTDRAHAQQLAKMAKRDGNLAMVRELVPPGCNERYPDDRFGIWCRCKLPPGHPFEHAFTYDGSHGQVTINWS